MTDTNHTDSVEAKNTAIHLTATLDTEVFKGRYSSSTLETIEAIIKRELTTLQVHTSQQIEEAVLQADATGAYHSGYLAGKAEVEEAVRKERERLFEEIREFTFKAQPYEGTMIRVWLNNYTPNHQD